MLDFGGVNPFPSSSLVKIAASACISCSNSSSSPSSMPVGWSYPALSWEIVCNKNDEDITSWWFQPLWKILVKFASFPQVGVKIKNIWNHQLDNEDVRDSSPNSLKIYTLGPQNHEKWRFYTPNIWVITTKNEGCGFPWQQIFAAKFVFVKCFGGDLWVVDFPAFPFGGIWTRPLKGKESFFRKYALVN